MISVSIGIDVPSLQEGVRFYSAAFGFCQDRRARSRRRRAPCRGRRDLPAREGAGLDTFAPHEGDPALRAPLDARAPRPACGRPESGAGPGRRGGRQAGAAFRRRRARLGGVLQRSLRPRLLPDRKKEEALALAPTGAFPEPGLPRGPVYHGLTQHRSGAAAARERQAPSEGHHHEEATMNEKALYQQKKQAQLDEWKADIAKLKAKAEGASAETQLAMNEQLKGLQARIDEGNSKPRGSSPGPVTRPGRRSRMAWSPRGMRSSPDSVTRRRSSGLSRPCGGCAGTGRSPVRCGKHR